MNFNSLGPFLLKKDGIQKCMKSNYRSWLVLSSRNIYDCTSCGSIAAATSTGMQLLMPPISKS
jgi:hypothetical protein